MKHLFHNAGVRSRFNALRFRFKIQVSNILRQTHETYANTLNREHLQGTAFQAEHHCASHHRDSATG